MGNRSKGLGMPCAILTWKMDYELNVPVRDSWD